MKQFLRASSTFLVILSILFVNPVIVLASEGDGGHGLEAEINGYHVTLASQNEWIKGENTIVVTLTDDTGMPVSDADVEILIAPKSDGHAEPEADAHGAETAHGSMPGMEQEEPQSETADAAAHEEERVIPLGMIETHEHGEYMVETHLESSGGHEVQVFFHVNGEMLQANFLVNVTGTTSKTIVLWSFAAVNVGLVAFAGVLKKQPVKVTGK